MRADIMAHKFIEFGKHQQHLYGIKVESVLEVVKTGRMCILDVHPQVCEWVGSPYVWVGMSPFLILNVLHPVIS